MGDGMSGQECVHVLGEGGKVNNRYQVLFTIIKQQDLFDKQFNYGCINMQYTQCSKSHLFRCWMKARKHGCRGFYLYHKNIFTLLVGGGKGRMSVSVRLLVLVSPSLAQNVC